MSKILLKKSKSLIFLDNFKSTADSHQQLRCEFGLHTRRVN